MNRKNKKFTGINIQKRKDSLKAEIPFLKILYASVSINIIVILFVLITKSRLPPEIPLYYGLPQGAGQLAESTKIIIPSLLAIMFILLNTAIVLLIKNEFLKKTLIITGLGLSMFSLTTTLKIMFLVGNF